MRKRRRSYCGTRIAGQPNRRFRTLSGRVRASGRDHETAASRVRRRARLPGRERTDPSPWARARCRRRRGTARSPPAPTASACRRGWRRRGHARTPTTSSRRGPSSRSCAAPLAVSRAPTAAVITRCHSGGPVVGTFAHHHLERREHAFAQRQHERLGEPFDQTLREPVACVHHRACGRRRTISSTVGVRGAPAHAPSCSLDGRASRVDVSILVFWRPQGVEQLVLLVLELTLHAGARTQPPRSRPWRRAGGAARRRRGGPIRQPRTSATSAPAPPDRARGDRACHHGDSNSGMSAAGSRNGLRLGFRLRLQVGAGVVTAGAASVGSRRRRRRRGGARTGCRGSRCSSVHPVHRRNAIGRPSAGARDGCAALRPGARGVRRRAVADADDLHATGVSRASFTSSVGTIMSRAPARRAVTAFCFTPPTRPTDPSSRIVPVIATFAAAGQVAGGQLVDDRERERQTRRRTTDPLRVDATSTGIWCRISVLREDADVRHTLELIARDFDLVFTELHRHVDDLTVAIDGEHHAVARPASPE